MKVIGTLNPGKFSVEKISNTPNSLIRLYQNVKPYTDPETDFTGFQYDEYHVTVQTWDGLYANVEANYDVFLAKGKDNEIDRSNIALSKAQADADMLSVDHEFRLTMLELGL